MYKPTLHGNENAFSLHDTFTEMIVCHYGGKSIIKTKQCNLQYNNTCYYLFSFYWNVLIDLWNKYLCSIQILVFVYNLYYYPCSPPNSKYLGHVPCSIWLPWIFDCNRKLLTVSYFFYISSTVYIANISQGMTPILFSYQPVDLYDVNKSTFVIVY